MFYQLFDPELNMDLCCCGLMKARKGTAIIGCLEIIGSVLALAQVLVAASLSGQLQWSILIAVVVIALANFVTIPVMFLGLKRRKASLISWHLVVHVVNVISLVFVLLISSTFLVVASSEQQSQQSSVADATLNNDTSSIENQVTDVDSLRNARWIAQIIICTFCLIAETWFFNVEYTVFLQFCKRNSPTTGNELNNNDLGQSSTKNKLTATQNP